MIGEIIFDIFVFLHYNFKTTLPYKWDFCRLQLARNSKLFINSSSYFIVYAAFTYWFVQYVIRCLTNLSDSQSRGKDRFLAYALSISTGAKIFWPLFLLTTYFFTCTFYPWFTTLAVIFLNYPSALTVLAPGGSGLQLSLQYFVEYVGIESDSREDFSPAERNEFHPSDASILGSTVVRPIRSRYSAESTEASDHQLIMRPLDTTVLGRQRSEMDAEASSSDDYITGVRILRPSEASVSHGTEIPLVLSTSSERYAESSHMHLKQHLKTSSRIPGVAETELFSFTSSENLADSSDIQLIRYPRTSSRIPGVADAELFSYTSSEYHTETSDSRLRRQLTSREQEIIPPTSSRYYPISSQHSHSEDEIQHVSKTSYRRSLAKPIKESAEDNRKDSKYQETSQTLPKTIEELNTSYIRQSHLTSDEDLEREKVSKRKLKTQREVRGRSKEIEGIDVSISTAGESVFGDWRRRLGYCGHCGLHDNLPFRQDFSELRTPYRTRSGFIYGPIRRLLNLPDFLKYYIRR